ncbi:MAG: hypothetical protein M3310_03725 [Actinomycetota bacterium]|nr:hypothetical protein [Actinomycetota bacterium]
MPYQVALTIAAPVRAGAEEELDRLLSTMGDGVANGSVLDLGRLPDVHFARLAVVPAATDVRGRPLPAWLLYIADGDRPKARQLDDLVALGGSGIDRVFGHCDGYPPGTPSDAERLAYLRRHVIREAATYVNTRGRTVRQVVQEARLREAVDGFLDRARHDLRGKGPADIRRAVIEFVGANAELAWARAPAEQPTLPERAREAAHAAGVGLTVVLALPLAVVGAPAFAIMLRRRERSDEAPHHRPPEQLVLELSALEDHLPINPFTAVGHVKPGRFRGLTIRAIFFLLGATTRHVLKPGDLVGVKTIHFARWIFLDDRRRVVFASNYDGSLENYMDDFIDKIGWGLNLVFSNGVGYPRTRWLVLDGCRDELAFKDYLRLHQIPTRVWHAAYGRLSALNVAANARLRKGLHGELDAAEEREWVQAL